MDLGYLWCSLCAEHGMPGVSHEVGSPPVSGEMPLGTGSGSGPPEPRISMLCPPQPGKSLPRTGWGGPPAPALLLPLCSRLQFKHLGGIFSTLGGFSAPWPCPGDGEGRGAVPDPSPPAPQSLLGSVVGLRGAACGPGHVGSSSSVLSRALSLSLVSHPALQGAFSASVPSTSILNPKKLVPNLPPCMLGDSQPLRPTRIPPHHPGTRSPRSHQALECH